MRTYEVIFILSPGLDPDAAENRAGEIRQTMTNAGVNVLYTESWGKRKLAYYVKKQNFGYYFFWQVEVNNETLRELDRMMKLQDNILKFIIVKGETDAVGQATPFMASERVKEVKEIKEPKEEEDEEEEG
ncbi:30S ribosomal protein S6 [bacterium]|nr:30S ribosomal protein S6 [bacterium]